MPACASLGRVSIVRLKPATDVTVGNAALCRFGRIATSGQGAARAGLGRAGANRVSRLHPTNMGRDRQLSVSAQTLQNVSQPLQTITL